VKEVLVGGKVIREEGEIGLVNGVMDNVGDEIGVREVEWKVNEDDEEGRNGGKWVVVEVVEEVDDKDCWGWEGCKGVCYWS
ncbi:hypothetical protein, partial [Paenibacillus xylanexedens]|uniref:hypothetical protein n=1 Tax=Paenibacillus xylanexedens TaxID=528191 RepID=UPI0016432204